MVSSLWVTLHKLSIEVATHLLENACLCQTLLLPDLCSGISPTIFDLLGYYGLFDFFRLWIYDKAYERSQRNKLCLKSQYPNHPKTLCMRVIIICGKTPKNFSILSTLSDLKLSCPQKKKKNLKLSLSSPFFRERMFFVSSSSGR